MRRHFLVDASALVPFFLNAPGLSQKARAMVAKLLRLRNDKKASLYIPSFCMAECSKAFAEIAYSKWHDHGKASENYMKYVDMLLDVVSSRRQGLIQSLSLKRRHLVDLEDIFKAEYLISSRGGDKRLSGLDALVISVGRRLGAIHGLGNVLIVTGDKIMARVCNQDRLMFPKAVYVFEDQVPDS